MENPCILNDEVCAPSYGYIHRKKLNDDIDAFIVSRCQMSLVMRKPDFCICEKKDADQLRGNREADQRLCFRYTDGTIPLLSKSFQASSHLLWLYSLVFVGPGRKPRRPVFSERGSNESMRNCACTVTVHKLVKFMVQSCASFICYI